MFSTVSEGDTDVAESWIVGLIETVSTVLVVCCRKVVIVSVETISVSVCDEISGLFSMMGIILSEEIISDLLVIVSGQII